MHGRKATDRARRGGPDCQAPARRAASSNAQGKNQIRAVGGWKTLAGKPSPARTKVAGGSDAGAGSITTNRVGGSMRISGRSSTTLSAQGRLPLSTPARALQAEAYADITTAKSNSAAAPSRK